MMRINNKMILGLVIASIFLLGPAISPAAALQTNMVEEIFNYDFAPGANNHTYIYAPPRVPTFVTSLQSLDFSEDTDLARYSYVNGGWTSSYPSYSEDSTALWNWISSNTIDGGPMGDPLYLPRFYFFRHYSISIDRFYIRFFLFLVIGNFGFFSCPRF